MGVLLSREPCPECGGRHDFYAPGGGGFSARAGYAFVCPATGRPAVLRPGGAHAPAASPPAGAVAVAPVPRRRGRLTSGRGVFTGTANRGRPMAAEATIFAAMGSDGETYTVTYAPAPDADPAAEPGTNYGELTTSDNQAVARLGKGSYLVVETGVTLTTDSPHAP